MRLNVFIVVVGMLLVCSGLVSAGLTIGNKSYEVKSSYSTGEVIGGWINISLSNEPGSSKLSAFNDDIGILDFLNENGFDCSSSASCSCVPSDCEGGFSSSGGGSASKVLNLASWEEKLIGVRLDGEISSVNEFSFKLVSDVADSCVSQLKINFFDDVEWNAGKLMEDVCPMENSYGCYNSAHSNKTTILNISYTYCEKINLNGRGFKIGAGVNGTGNANFKMSVNSDENYEECTVSISQGGEFGCFIEFDEEINEEADVCLNVQSGSYSIPYEEVSPCGYTGAYDYDFKIFAKPRKYASIGSINFSDYVNEFEDYIFNKYDGDCSDGCFVPILIQGIGQSVTLSDLRLVYSAEGLKVENNFYDLNEGDFLISSNYLKLDLDKADLKVPLTAGSKQLVLELGSKKILDKSIEVKKGVNIQEIIPKEVPALVPVTFIILTEGNASADFEWDFGDGTVVSGGKKVVHTYSDVGSYELKVSIESGSKTVSIEVKSPVDSVNKTINDYRGYLNSAKTEIDKLQTWVKNGVNERINLEDLDAKIGEQEDRTDDGIDEEEAIDIMKKLLELKIPRNFRTGLIINKVDIIQDDDVLDLSVLKEMGAGNFEGGRAGYISAINTWMVANLDLRMESKTYSIYYEEGEEDLVSHVKVYLGPKKDLGRVYFMVDRDVEFSGGDINNGKVFDSLAGEEVIEFLYPGRVTINNIPVYVSPKEGELELGVDVDVCDNDGVCEDGEDSENCKNDCKSWFGLTSMLIILFVVAFIAYIILQEWYKRFYERHLFQDKNQLFNLVHFMNNSLIQGTKKSDIFKKLDGVGWKGEQMTYAWRKLHGKRTGMWEIPLFKWVEKREVKRELAQRGGGRVMLPRGGGIGGGFGGGSMQGGGSGLGGNGSVRNRRRFFPRGNDKL